MATQYYQWDADPGQGVEGVERIMTDNTKKKQEPHRFKKGQSGNPNGRPKGSGNRIEYWLNKKAEEKSKINSKKSNQEMMAEIAWEKAVEGDIQFINFVTNHLKGKPVETVRTQEIDKDEIVDI